MAKPTPYSLRPDGTTGAVAPGADPGAGVEELLELIRRRPAWHADAACREHPEIDFFPERGRSTEAARAVCAGCLVAPECLAYALDDWSCRVNGIWGGTSAVARRRMRAVSSRRSA